MRKEHQDIFAADYYPKGCNDFHEKLETVTGADLAGVVEEAKALNTICKDECYRVRRLSWEPGLSQYTPQEFYDCTTLEAI